MYTIYCKKPPTQKTKVYFLFLLPSRLLSGAGVQHNIDCTACCQHIIGLRYTLTSVYTVQCTPFSIDCTVCCQHIIGLRYNLTSVYTVQLHPFLLTVQLAVNTLMDSSTLWPLHIYAVQCTPLLLTLLLTV